MHPWAVSEAGWTYGFFGVEGRARRGDLATLNRDPASGLVLEDGCRPEEGRARTEVFLESELPARICPAGEPARPGFLTRVGRAVAGFFERVGGFIAGLFDREDDDEQRRRDRYLGRPRLPREADIDTRLIPDTLRMGEPLGVPVDSLPDDFGVRPIIIDTPIANIGDTR